MPGKTIDQLPLATSLSDNDQVIVRDPDDISGLRTRKAPLSTLGNYLANYITDLTIDPAPLTKSDDTNVTLTLGGTPQSALLQPVSIAVGWNGALSVARGGTGASDAPTARTNLGLGNVDNTSDATKNTATATLSNKTLASPVLAFGTGSTQFINAQSANTGSPNYLQSVNSGTSSNSGTIAGVVASLANIANGTVYIQVQGGASPNASLYSGAGVTGGLAIAAAAGLLFLSGASGIKLGTASGLAKLTSGVLGTATAGTDFQAPITLTTTGTSGAATFIGNTLNIPQYSAGAGSGDTSTNTSTSVVNELALFADTSGKLLKRSTGSGIATLTSGVLGTITAPAGAIVGTSDTQALTNKDLTSGTNTFPTLNQNTTGSAAKWTTARNLAGNSVDGSANVTFANKFIVQGTTDAGLSGAQFLGALGTGLLKNTTTTGVLSIAAAGTDYQAPISIAANSVLGNNTGSSAAPASISPSQVLDIIGATQGTLLYRGVSAWTALSPGTAGQVLQSGGASANPSWTAVSASAGGSNGQVQYNSSGALGGSAAFTFSSGGTLSLGVAGTSNGSIQLANGSASASAIIQVPAGLSTTAAITLPSSTTTLAGTNTADTFTNKTYDTAGAGNVFKINGTTISAVTGSGSAVLATSPTLVTPTLGAAAATSINKVSITAPATGSTLVIADGKTFTASNSITLAGTDGKTLTASNSLTLAGTDATTITFGPTGTYYPITRLTNAQTGTTYTFLLSDQGKYCTFANASPVTVTVPPNSSVAFPVGTQIDCSALGAGKVTFAQGSGVTINSAGGNKAIGSQYAGATLIKEATDTWTLMGNLQA